jgi:DNA repair exonuclease SbcCD ATPase subunit
MLKEIEEKIDSINKKIEKIDSDKLQKSISKLEEKINKGKEKKRKAERKYIEAKTRISDYEESKADENDKIICPNCKTEISITDYFNKIDINEYKETMNKSSKLIEKINDKTSEWSEKLISYEEQYDTLDEHKKTIRRKNKEKKDIEDKINSGKKDIEKKIKSIEKKMGELKKNKLVFDRELRYLDLIQRIVSDEGLRKYIIKTIIPYINRKIQYYIQEFELPYNVKFDDTFDIFITDGRNEVEWGELSSGQQTSVNLSILFAFYYFIRVKSMFNLNLQFFDEIMDRSLDPEKTKLIFDILKKDDLFFDKNIVIITHKETIKSYEFDRTIKAELVNFTRYYEVGENN